MTFSNRFKALMLSLPILFLLGGCGGRRVIGTQNVVEKSGNLPEWTVKVPKSRDGMMFFRGLKTGAISLEAALTDARMHATRQVAEMVQTEANIDYENARVEYGLARDDADIGSVIRDGIIMLSDAVIQGVKEKESYWEKVEEITPTGVQYFYNLYTLISLSEDDYKRITLEIIERQKEEARARNNEKAEKFLDGFREEILERNFFREGE